MKIDLGGRTAIVSGFSAGIAWGCARALAGAGAVVVLTVRDADGLAAARDRLIAAEPRCDVLVNNLGQYAPKPFADATDDDWRASLDVTSWPACGCRGATCRG